MFLYMMAKLCLYMETLKVLLVFGRNSPPTVSILISPCSNTLLGSRDCGNDIARKTTKVLRDQWSYLAWEAEHCGGAFSTMFRWNRMTLSKMLSRRWLSGIGGGVTHTWMPRVCMGRNPGLKALGTSTLGVFAISCSRLKKKMASIEWLACMVEASPSLGKLSSQITIVLVVWSTQSHDESLSSSWVSQNWTASFNLIQFVARGQAMGNVNSIGPMCFIWHS